MSSVRRSSSISSCRCLRTRAVDRGERLVEEQDCRLPRQRPGQRHALALAARQRARSAIQVSGQMHQRQQLLGA